MGGGGGFSHFPMTSIVWPCPLCQSLQILGPWAIHPPRRRRSLTTLKRSLPSSHHFAATVGSVRFGFGLKLNQTASFSEELNRTEDNGSTTDGYAKWSIQAALARASACHQKIKLSRVKLIL